jgi:hypothetical protein
MPDNHELEPESPAGISSQGIRSGRKAKQRDFLIGIAIHFGISFAVSIVTTPLLFNGLKASPWLYYVWVIPMSFPLIAAAIFYNKGRNSIAAGILAAYLILPLLALLLVGACFMVFFGANGFR